MKPNPKVFVCGLPRSRTAWFANFLTYGGSFVYHDGFMGLDSLDEFPERMKGADGNSDPANVLVWEKVHEWFPDAKWVVIERNPMDVLMSCRKIIPIPYDNLVIMHNRLEQLKVALNPMVIQFESITPDVARSVADYCGIDSGPFIRAEQLCRMNVQVDPTTLQEMIMEATLKLPLAA